MKHYRHMTTMRDQFIAERRQARIQAGFDFLVVVLTTIFLYVLTIWAMS